MLRILRRSLTIDMVTNCVVGETPTHNSIPGLTEILMSVIPYSTWRHEDTVEWHIYTSRPKDLYIYLDQVFVAPANLGPGSALWKTPILFNDYYPFYFQDLKIPGYITFSSFTARLRPLLGLSLSFLVTVITLLYPPHADFARNGCITQCQNS